MNAVRNHFGVRFGGELVTCRTQLGTQLVVILDDPAVDERETISGDVWRGVALTRPTMSRPTRVGDADRAMGW